MIPEEEEWFEQLSLGMSDCVFLVSICSMSIAIRNGLDIVMKDCLQDMLQVLCTMTGNGKCHIFH